MVLLRYPPPPAGSRQTGCGAHTDCGFLTLLQQDLDGLEIKDKQGNWVEAPRLERQGVDGVILVNLGDMAARWSNGLYKSTWHRVNNKTGRLRHSIPFFCNTNFDALVDPKTSVCAGSLSDVVGEARFGVQYLLWAPEARVHCRFGARAATVGIMICASSS